MLEFLDRDFRVRRRLILRLDDLVQVAQLGVEPRQRRVLFLKTMLSLAMPNLSFLDQMSCKSLYHGTAQNESRTSPLATLSARYLSSLRILSIPADALASAERAEGMSASACSR